MALTLQSALILQAIENGYVFGFDIMRITELPSGTVYPALRRLERQGLIASRWAGGDEAHADARPARKYFKLAPRGTRQLADCRQQEKFIGRALSAVPLKAATEGATP